LIESGQADDKTLAWHLNLTVREQHNKTLVSCTCSFNSSNTGAGGSVWGPPYAGLDVAMDMFCPDLPWKYCDMENMAQPDPQTPAGIAASRALVEFCVEVMQIMIAPPATSLQLTKEAWQSARLAKTRSKPRSREAQAERNVLRRSACAMNAASVPNGHSNRAP
jgi:hypothetical protein